MHLYLFCRQSASPASQSKHPPLSISSTLKLSVGCLHGLQLDWHWTHNRKEKKKSILSCLYHKCSSTAREPVSLWHTLFFLHLALHICLKKQLLTVIGLDCSESKWRHLKVWVVMMMVVVVSGSKHPTESSMLHTASSRGCLQSQTTSSVPTQQTNKQKQKGEVIKNVGKCSVGCPL